MRNLGPGTTEPLGLTLVEGGANVAVYSAHAEALAVCLFDRNGDSEETRILLPERTGDVFHGFVSGVGEGDRYGLRAWGPYAPAAGHRFNPAKLLVDPYAKALDRPFAFDAALVGGDHAQRDDVDSAHHVPKAIATPGVMPSVTSRPRIPWSDTVLYELHVRGFTRAHPEIPETIRGTCAGLSHPVAIAHLHRLGITTIELMPIAAWIDERHLARQGLRNYWGYNPVAWFVPDPKLAPGGIAELKSCVDALHASGIEVVLDIVLNHSGEGDAFGPTLSLRGLDNATYYRTHADDRARYIDDTGCGNTLALDRPPLVRLAMDALRYYAEVAGVDGFRFDLASILGRREHGFDADAPLLQAIAQDPLLRQLKLIAEPWDVGPGGHRLGAFPAEWGEWNDRFRDATRRFWRGDASLIGELATRFAGSADIFARHARPPSRSINFVAAHDGFTLRDLVSYAAKHNLDNGEDNRDGSETNSSWNHGVEGPTADAAIVASREADVRALLATLLLARGTPMLAMGDELGKTQRGNNNAYAQDSAMTWVDWQSADAKLIAFVASLIELRRQHRALANDRWLTGAPADELGIPDVEWHRADGRTMSREDWTDPSAHALVAILYARPTGGDADRVAIAFNAEARSLSMRCPEARNGHGWRLRVDTSSAEPPTPAIVSGESIAVAARSIVVLTEEQTATSGTRNLGVDSDVLDRLAQAVGIAPEWWDVAGVRHLVSDDTKRALLAAMNLQVDSTFHARARLVEITQARELRPLPPMAVAREGMAPRLALVIPDDARGRRVVLNIDLEDGTQETLRFVVDDLPTNLATGPDGRSIAQRMLGLPVLPRGYHTATLDDDRDRPCRIVVAPDRCYLPSALSSGLRRAGLATHLYSLRRRGDHGIGDFTTLSIVGERTARAGGAIVAINPLHALFTQNRERVSPYHPSDRRFLDPIYVDVARIPDLAACDDARALLAKNEARINALTQDPYVDYDGVWALKRAILGACFGCFEKRARADPLVSQFNRYVAANGKALWQYAVFEAIAAAYPREPWQRWPEGLSHPDAPQVAAFALAHERDVRFVCYLQWLADMQFAESAQNANAGGLTLGFLRDLAIGAAPDGAEPWANAAGFARGVSIGAPPDPFSAAGQNWNLPPPNPQAMIATGCAAFRELVAANMLHAGGLRIDHVMGLLRLFWIPDGATPNDGAYVRYPQDALLAVLRQESARARSLVIGEDLGTVPDGFRDGLSASDVLSYRVLWFEQEGGQFKTPSRYSAKAAACVSTHDLPTIAGWWSGTDIDEKHSLRMLTDDAAALERRERTQSKAALIAALEESGVVGANVLKPSSPHDAGITAAIHGYLCDSASALVLLQADDLAGETAALNLPGTDRGRPNWRRKLRVNVEALWKTRSGRAAGEDFARHHRREGE